MAHGENNPVNNFRNYLSILNDPSASEDIKLKATQELSEHFEMIMQSPSYPSFLENALKIFMRILQEGEPQFIQENTIQHVSIFLVLGIQHIIRSMYACVYVCICSVYCVQTFLSYSNLL